MKTYDIEVQRLKSMKHDKGLIEIGIDVLVLPRPVRDDQSATSCLRLPVEHARSLLILLKQQLAELDKLQPPRKEPEVMTMTISAGTSATTDPGADAQQRYAMWRQSRSSRAALASLFARWRGIAIAAFGPRSPGRITALVLTTACSACSTSAPRHEWEQRLQGNAVAMLGEVHDNAQPHRDRLEVLRRALVAGWRPAIAMEQFDREHQSDIALARQERPRDAQYLIDLAAPSGTKARDGWNWAFYRPFVALALQYDLPLIAANLSNADTTRIVHDGYSAVFDVASLAALQLDKPIASDWQAAQEREIDAGHCGALQPAQWPRMARAQFARDAVMAQVLREHAAQGVVLLAGNGHVRRDTGVPRWMGDAWRERIVSVGYLETGDESLPALAFDAVVWVTPAPRPNPCIAFKPPGTSISRAPAVMDNAEDHCQRSSTNTEDRRSSNVCQASTGAGPDGEKATAAPACSWCASRRSVRKRASTPARAVVSPPGAASA